jgi:small neutral amino acid transporter SnatA (MarC family)
VRGRVVGAGVGLALVAVGVFGVVSPPERCPEVTVDDLHEASARTVDWFVHNQSSDGTWLYQYARADDRVIADYNVVRHAGAIMGLYQAALAGYPGAQESADAGVDWLLGHTFDEHGWTAIAYQGDVSTGSTALLIAGLTDRRLLTDDDQYDDLLRRLGGFLAAQTEPSGAVLAYYSRAAGEPVAGTYSKYYTGESYWALARLHRTFPDEGWGELADRVGDYLATRRDDVEDNWPIIPDHWAAYGLSETVEFPDRAERADRSDHDGGGPLTHDEIAYTQRQSEMFGGQVRWVSQRFGPWGIAVRTPHVPRGGGYGVVGEALTGFWRVAEADPRLADLRGPIAHQARCMAGLAIEAQSDAADAARFERPDRVEGAWFRDGETRMDDQQHALAALLRTVAIVESDDAAGSTSPRGGDMPAFWLWLLVLVAVVNPFRTALAVPRLGRSRREVGEIALLGGLVAGVGAVVVAALSGPLLDALDVSGPSIRLAAGIVAGVTGLVALLRRPPAAEPALPGRAAALVPVAVPFVATPGLLFAAMSAHSDHGYPVLLLALAIAIALLTALSTWLPSPAPALAAEAEGAEPARAPSTGASTDADTQPEFADGGVGVDTAAAPATAPTITHRLVAWAGRLTGAALVAACVALVIDGVLAV